ncbi:MAG TPA: DinB family protein [Spirochaetia bacterium]|nr:DinB family protein [Spirochaetia bacterium]
MYMTVLEFVEDWRRESGISLKVLRALTDQSLSQKSDPEGNALGRIAYHMVKMIGGNGTALGLEVAAPPREAEPPAQAAQIAAEYEKAAQSLADQVTQKITDSRLPTEITMFGRTMPLAVALQTLIRHQIHHRGQMSILMRSAGVVVPGIYGPSREESAAMRARQK